MQVYVLPPSLITGSPVHSPGITCPPGVPFARAYVFSPVYEIQSGSAAWVV